MVVSPGRRATFGEIDALARASSPRRLATAPIESASLVGLAAPERSRVPGGFLAIRRAGHAALLLDHAAPPEDRRRALDVLGASALLECEPAWPSSDRDFRLAEVGAGPDRDRCATSRW